MNEMHNKNEGFTLVELIIVVAIMGVLIALLAPDMWKRAARRLILRMSVQHMQKLWQK